MFNLFKKRTEKPVLPAGKTMSRDDIIAFLKTSPKKFLEFEEFYKTEILPHDVPSDADTFLLNAKQAAAFGRKPVSDADLSELEDRIVSELYALTEINVYSGHGLVNRTKKADGTTPSCIPVTLDEVMAIPEIVRPDLTGRLMHRYIDGSSGEASLALLLKIKATKDKNLKRQMYHCFRQGLEIADVDALQYAIINTNANSIGHWLPALVAANADKDFFKIPKTTYVKLPVTMLELTKTDYMSLTQTTKNIVDKWAMRAFSLDESKDYFVKNGVYSNKFDFRNCHVCGEKEVKELGEYLLFIHFAACEMASPLNCPCIYGPGTTTEWVVREFIPDKENYPVIYKGLPLHTEYRVFIDCDTDRILGIHPYWDPEVMEKRFDEHRDDHDEHDAIAYRAYENTLMEKYENNKDLVSRKAAELLPDLNLKGQWSLDVMQNDDDFWLIDMALAEQSAGYLKTVKLADRRPSKENWIPEI